VSGNIHAQAAQLLNQAPDFRAVGGDFLGNLGPADDDGCVLGQQADDAAQAAVRRLLLVWSGSRRPLAFARANWAGLADAEIMRESSRKDNALTSSAKAGLSARFPSQR
jgi:hypothetical protein